MYSCSRIFEKQSFNDSRSSTSQRSVVFFLATIGFDCKHVEKKLFSNPYLQFSIVDEYECRIDVLYAFLNRKIYR